jgi:periplasmic protein CpxP/Spy
MENETRHSDDTSRPASRNWPKIIAVGAAALTALAGVGLATAWGDDFGRGNAPAFGRYMMHTHMGGFGRGHGIGRMLDAIDASAEQEEKLWAIVDDTRGKLRPMFREFRDTRETLAELLGAPTIDREAVEQLRSERVTAIEEASRTMTAAVLEAVEVLTPEQRAKLVEHFKDRRSHRRW